MLLGNKVLQVLKMDLFISNKKAWLQHCEKKIEKSKKLREISQLVAATNEKEKGKESVRPSTVERSGEFNFNLAPNPPPIAENRKAMTNTNDSAIKPNSTNSKSNASSNNNSASDIAKLVQEPKKEEGSVKKEKKPKKSKKSKKSHDESEDNEKKRKRRDSIGLGSAEESTKRKKEKLDRSS
jgi:hypothetical protein